MNDDDDDEKDPLYMYAEALAVGQKWIIYTNVYIYVYLIYFLVTWRSNKT